MNYAVYFFPFVVMFYARKPLSAITCLFLQISIVGWPVGMFWASQALTSYKSKQRFVLAAERLQAKKHNAKQQHNNQYVDFS